MKMKNPYIVIGIAILNFALIRAQEKVESRSVENDQPILRAGDWSKNYIVSGELTQAVKNTDGVNDLGAIITAKFYDGLGREEQTVVRCGSGNGATDLANYIEYNDRGLPIRKWISVSSTGLPGDAVYCPLAELQPKYAEIFNDTKCYESFTYELTPMARNTQISAPGTAWQTHSGVRKEYLINKINGIHSCQKFTINNGALCNQGRYAIGELSILAVTDEDGHQILQFTDKDGQTVLERRVTEDAYADTYFIYDVYRNLSYVLPPKASAELSSVSGSIPHTNECLKKLAYVYTYDSKNRCISKKLPGCEPIYYVYDKYHHPIFSQDGNQRAKGKWAFTVYDRLGRVAYSGVTTDSRTAAQLQNAYGLSHYMAEFSPQNELGYPILYENVCINDIKLVNYYDSYDFLNKFAVGDSLQYRAMANFDEKYVNNTHPQISAKGLLTGSMARTLDADGAPLLKSIYYDYHGNVIQSHESNLVGGFNREYHHLSFTGKPLSTLQVHSTDSCAWSDLYTFTYDHMERLLTTSLSHNNADAITLSSNTYDEVGRLASCTVNDGGSNTSYAYNVRGWMQSVVNNHFYQWLHYQDAPAGGTPCFNGNISGITWLQRESMKAATSAESVYRFQYDGLNRLTQAVYASNSEQWNGDLLAMNDRNFSCTYAYDLNSNMTALQRYGVDVYNTSLPTHIRHHGMIDDLTMTYDGNQLKKVSDQCEELSYAGAMDFKDGADKDEEYTYDDNGNMTCDRNKGIHSITYNMLNLPEKVLFNDGHETRYTYAADGRKLRTEYRLNNFAIIDAAEEAEPANPDPGTALTPGTFSLPGVGGVIDDPIELEPAYTTLMTRDYCGNYIYSNGTLERILTGNGYIQGGEYYFYIKDYQGNIRVVLNQANVPVELNSYYPYGALMAATTEGTQPYKYSAKELDRENGLDLYDSQARHYDPIIPRTTTIDPLAEKYYSLSPYTWCAANPLKYIDFDGRDNYQVDSLGNISLIQKNSDALDRIYAISDQTTPNYINVDKSFMASEKTEMIKQKSSLYGNGEVKVSTYRGVDANQVYYFMRDHTLVEWTLVNNTYIGTCHDRNKDATASYLFEELINNNQAISEMRHIHPGGGKAISQGDSEVAKMIQNHFPSAKLYIDIPSKFGGVLFKEYDQYDIVGLLEEVVCKGKKVKK